MRRVCGFNRNTEAFRRVRVEIGQNTLISSQHLLQEEGREKRSHGIEIESERRQHK